MTRSNLFSLSGFSLLSLATLIAFGFSHRLALGQMPLRIRESKPVTVNGAKFVAVTQTNWVGLEPVDGPRPMQIETQLRLSNLKKVDVVFLTAATFGLTLKKQNGGEVSPRTGGEHPLAPRPIQLAAGTAYTITRQALLIFDPKFKGSTLIYRDGTGDWKEYGPLRTGKYKLGFWYSTNRIKSNDRPTQIDGVPIWTGDAQTQEIDFEVLNPPYPGRASDK